MRRKLIALCLLLLLAGVSSPGEFRAWTDKSGKHQVEAELLWSDGGHVALRNREGQEIKIPLEKLSETDQRFVREQGNDGPRDDGTAEAEPATYRDIEGIFREQRYASQIVHLLEGFLETNDISENDKELAREKLTEWQKLSEQDVLRVGTKWMTPAEFQEAKQSEIRLIKEAHRLIDIKSDDLARDKFLEASEVNPQGVRADFYLGLLNALVAHHPPDAEEHFRECIKRLSRDDDLMTGTRKANYIAALNNLAVIQVRKHNYKGAIRSWRTALEIAPFTPELVQNLGLMTRLANTATYVAIPKVLRSSAGNLYAKVSVSNSLARFDDGVGWLYLPYIDTLDGSMDSDGDEELVTVAWCTGFSVGGDYVITSRYPLLEADRIVVREGGKVFEVQSGKVVAISERSNLALLRIEGLGSQALPLGLKIPTPAQDVTIAGYREPGFGNATFQTRVATIVDLPLVLRHVRTSTYGPEGTGISLRVSWFNYRDMLMHDAITNAGMEGAPLLDQQGKVVGVHIGNRPSFGKYGSKLSLAEPTNYAVGFLKSILPNLDTSEIENGDHDSFDSKQFKELLKTSVYQLAVQKRAPRLAWSHRIEELHKAQRQGSWTSYEDRTCMACNGRLTLRCPTCRGTGTVRVSVPRLMTKNPQTGQEVWANVGVKKKCPTCHGKKTVDCPNCDRDGIDNMLR